MLYTLISSHLFVKKGWLFHFPEWVQQHLNKWELRSVVLLSLFFQIVLIFLGDRRRYIHTIWLNFILWIAYLCADWVAAVALGILSHGMEEPKINELPAMWAPFLLLHLGGPDTITAFSLEDNELWLRHLLGLVIQGSIASYVSIRSWTGTPVSIISILMYVPAIVKYGERTCVLCSASKEHLRDSMLDPADPGPSYVKFVDEYSSKQEDGFRVTIERIEDQSSRRKGRKAMDQSRLASGIVSTSGDSDDDADMILVKADYFFGIFKRLFAFLIVSHEDWKESKLFFQQISYTMAFKLIDVELGFMFNALYTKAAVVYSMVGCILRSISLSFTICVFVVFLHVDTHRHPTTDIIITYQLLILAIILEIYGATILISSDSSFLWLRNKGYPRLAKLVLRYRGQRTRWSNSISQYNLLQLWLKDKPTGFLRELRKIFGIDKKVRKYLYTFYDEVPPKLKEFIFQQLRRKSDEATDFKRAKSLCRNRGGEVLKKNSRIYDLLGWSIVDVEFDQSILIWHIATDLCYQSDHTFCTEREIGKILSDYMVFLLVVCPFMLPEGIGEIRCLDTEGEAMKFFKDKSNLDRTKACELLLEVNTEIPPIEVKGPKSKSVLFDACRLANQLGLLTRNEKWGTISQVWVEMLSYAAAQCKGPNHAQQLGQGGELLTHVWLLMAHLGITEQFQMPTGFAKKLTYR